MAIEACNRADLGTPDVSFNADRCGGDVDRPGGISDLRILWPQQGSEDLSLLAFYYCKK